MARDDAGTLPIGVDGQAAVMPADRLAKVIVQAECSWQLIGTSPIARVDIRNTSPKSNVGLLMDGIFRS